MPWCAALSVACGWAGRLAVDLKSAASSAFHCSSPNVITSLLFSVCAQVLVLDEADLLLSYGYEDDVAALAPQIPRSCQCMLMSATSSEDVDRLTKLVLHNPLALNLLGAATGGGEVRARGSCGLGCGPSDHAGAAQPAGAQPAVSCNEVCAAASWLAGEALGGEGIERASERTQASQTSY